jgi:exodeoxyribonuclease-5
MILASEAATFDLSQEQTDVVSAVVDGVYQGKTEQTVAGYAGTGKTTCIKAMMVGLPQFAVCAFTGKAANILRRKGIDDASTIHSAIYRPEQSGGRVHFVLRDRMPDEVEGFIVDEASMVSESLYRDLTSFDLPIIFVGDHGQLEPVGSKFNLMESPDYTLEKIHRNSGEIPRFAEWLRLGRRAADFAPRSNEVTLIRDGEVDDDLVKLIDQVICAFNRTRVHLNKYMRKLLGYTSLLEVGERVMCLRNDRDEGIFNGMQGTVSKVERDKGDVWIDFDVHDGTRSDLMIDPAQFGKEKSPGMDEPWRGHPFDYAHAITAHKAQGDEWPTVLVFEQRCQHWDHRRWAYTAASRAQSRLYWVCEEGARWSRSTK